MRNIYPEEGEESWPVGVEWPARSGYTKWKLTSLPTISILNGNQVVSLERSEVQVPEYFPRWQTVGGFGRSFVLNFYLKAGAASLGAAEKI